MSLLPAKPSADNRLVFEWLLCVCSLFYSQTTITIPFTNISQQPSVLLAILNIFFSQVFISLSRFVGKILCMSSSLLDYNIRSRPLQGVFLTKTMVYNYVIVLPALWAP